MRTIRLLATALLLVGCARIRYSPMAAPSHTGAKEGAASVSVVFGGDSGHYCTEFRIDGQTIEVAHPAEPSEAKPRAMSNEEWERCLAWDDWRLVPWTGVVAQGRHEFQFVLSDGKAVKRTIDVQESIRVELTPRRADVFFHSGGFLIMVPLTIVTWPVWGPMAMVQGG